MFNNLGLRFLKIGAAVTVVFWVYVLPENILFRTVRKLLYLKQETLSSIWGLQRCSYNAMKLVNTL